MLMLTAIIVDDEPYSILTLEMMLKEYCSDKVKLLGSKAINIVINNACFSLRNSLVSK